MTEDPGNDFKWPRDREESPGGRLSQPSIFRDAALFAGAYLLLALAIRCLLLHLLKADGNRLTELTIRNLPLLFQEDLFGLGPTLAVYLLLRLIFPLRPLRPLITGLPLLLSGFLLISAVQYYLLFEEPFRLEHLRHVEGAGEMANSILAGLHPDFPIWMILLYLYVLIWGAFTARFTFRPCRETNRWKYHLSQTGWGLIFITLALAPIGILHSLPPHPIGEKIPTPDQRVGPTVEELAFNVIYRNTPAPFSPPQRQGDGRIREKTDDEETAPFRFHFNDASLENKRLLPRIPFPGRGRRFNIVLYLFEGVPRSYLTKKVNGRPIMPVWNRLIKHSLYARNHYAQYPLSVNALFNVLMSAYPLPADRWPVSDYPDIAIASLPEMLKAEGYATALLHTGYFDYAGQRAFLQHRHFDLLDDTEQLRVPPYTATLNWGIDDRALLKPALHFATAGPNSPFFLMLMPVTPHHPYQVPAENFRIVRPPAGAGFRELRHAEYLNSLHYADSVLGDFIGKMEESGHDEDTLYFIVADHGEAFGRHRRNYNHPFYIYEENVHVPFIIYNRRLFPRTIPFDAISRHIDILPTICDLLNIPLREYHVGRSLFRPGPRRMAFMQTTWRNNLIGLRDDRWKYILDLRSGKEELYDLLVDPSEKNDLREEQSAIGRRYREVLFRLRAYQRRYFERIIGRKIDWKKTLDKTGL